MRCLALAAVLLLAESASTAAAAASLTPLADRRFMRAFDFTGFGGNQGDCGIKAPSQPFEHWVDVHGCVHGGVEGDSRVEAQQLVGLGYLSTTGGGHSVDVESVYDVDFGVDRTTPFRIELAIAFVFDEESPHAETGASARLLRDGVVVYEYSFDRFGNFWPASPISIGHAGVLDAGPVYSFETTLRSYSQAGVFATFDYLLAVPEPTTGALTAVGLVALVSLRRRRARSLPATRSHSSAGPGTPSAAGRGGSRR